jgi:hypothetical protein
MATTSSNELAQNLERLVAEFVRSSQEMVLAAMAQALVTSPCAPASAPLSTTKLSKRAKSSKRAKPSQRRTPAQVAERGDRFYKVLCAHPGETMTVLAAKVGSSPQELHRPVARLKRAGRVRSVGPRQLTRYFPMVGDAEAA